MKKDGRLGEYILSILGENIDADALPGDGKRGISNEQVKKITDDMSGGFFIYCANQSEKIIYANDALLKIFDCDTMSEFKEHTGNTFRGIVHPDDLDIVEESIECQIASSRYDLDYVEYRIIQKNGEIRWVEDYGHFVRSNDFGDVFCVFISDITERKKRQAEDGIAAEIYRQQMHEYYTELEGLSREHLRRLEVIEGLSVDYESIIYIDLDKDIMRAYRINDRIKEWFTGLSIRFSGFADEYVKMWVHPEDAEVFSHAMSEQYMRENLRNAKKYYISYRTVTNKKIEYMQMHVVNVGVGDSVSQIVLGVRNVDEEMRTEMIHRKTLENALKQAKSSVAAKNTFLANISHDMRTPMNAIIGFTALAKKNLDDKKKLKSYLDMMEASENQMLNIINDILELSRLEARKVSIEESICDLNEIAGEVYQKMIPCAEAKGINITLDTSELKDFCVFSDREKIRNILEHLVSNAVKYTDDEGNVVISVVQEDIISETHKIYRFIIEDNGIGISEGYLDKIFAPFERVKNATQSGVAGAGLGLTIVKYLVELLNGTVEVDSTIGEGSKFTVTLTMKLYRKEERDTEEELDGEAKQYAGKKVLIVEDNELNMEILREILQNIGMSTDSAENGKIGVEKVKASDPGEYSIILMDIQMPVMDGYCAAKEIRRLDNPKLAQIPIVAVSANAFDEDRQKSIESGMNAHMSKPINISELVEVLDKYIK